MLRRCGQVRTLFTHHKPSFEETKRNKEFFLTILAATATKRDAKAYIQRYQRPGRLPDRKQQQTLNEFFAGDHDEQEGLVSAPQPSSVRVALIVVRDLPRIHERQLRRIGYTLGQLQRLGLLPVVLVDGTSDGQASTSLLRFTQLLENMRIRSQPILDGLFKIQDTQIRIDVPNVLLEPAMRGRIPLIASNSVTTAGCRQAMQADDGLRALCRGFKASPSLTIDKLILLDPVGGIPSLDRRSGSHVLINLEQEDDDLQHQLSERYTEKEASAHIRNLKLCHECLAELTETGSAVITTPTVAGSGPGEQHPLIHNLLTDKPMFSPSLPKRSDRTPATVTTVLRLGVPVRILRNVDLRGPEVDLPRLVALMNDSFGRQLDTEAYLERLQGQAAALIIAGDYDGAAIITYEHAHDAAKPVPYLDKFAVLRAKQGAGGVADLLFNAMIRAFPDELLWRSRANNPVNKWYFERACGTSSILGTHWKLFWTQPVKRQTRLAEYLDIGRKIQATWLD